ncbi:MAG: hypothetical protein ACYS0I_11880, partial [Planctomycetota bacterium]
GPVCKHMVAVLYAIQAQTGEVTNQRDKRSKRSKPKRPTISQQLNQALDQISQADLQQIIKDYAQRDRLFRSFLLSHPLLVQQVADKATHREIVKASIQSARGQHGMIDYWSASKAAEGALNLLQQANQLVETRKVDVAIPMYQVIIEELVPTLQYADDSNGELGGAIESAFEGLLNCACRLESVETKKQFFDYCLNEYNKKKYQAWDWPWTFLHIAAKLVKTAKQENRLLNRIDEMASQKSDSWLKKFDQERAAEIKLELFKHRHAKEAVSQFINTNLKHTPILRYALEQAFKQKNFAQVKKLAQEGITKAQRQGCPGLVDEWQRWLLKTAQAEDDIESIRKYAKQLFLSKHHEFDYYQILKNTYQIADWNKEVEEILTKIAENDYYVRAEIFIREQDWERLLKIVQQNLTFDMLDAYHQNLTTHFPQKLIQLYEQAVQNYLEQRTGRKYYQEVCRRLGRMQKLGAGDRVEQLIKQWRQQYKNRPALLEELERI